MKAAAFAYHAPTSRAEAIGLLATHAGAARVLAGGQSLVPAMNFRLARPAVLVDINRLPGLDTLAAVSGMLHVGALCRHARFEQPVAEGPLGTLLPRIAACIASPPIRARGTFGGSLAHADPAAEWCALALALEAEIVAEGETGERVIPAARFFAGSFATALQSAELLTGIRLPLLSHAWRCGFAEFGRRANSAALALAVVALRLDCGRIVEAKVALGGVAATPVASPAAVAALVGQPPSEAVWGAASEAAAADLAPPADLHGSAGYRRHLAAAMLRRALRQCAP